ncbi:MAG: acyltransferase family protein [Planctomycetota bacterium]|nr:acyltransferase family protein [Planctomycetota bacterium]
MTLANSQTTTNKASLGWVGPVKALALIGILWNHLVEEFARGPWFTNPSGHWADWRTRFTDIFPTDYSFPASLMQFIGWLGDSAPGVFILLSGFTLVLAALNRGQEQVELRSFYRRRAIRIFPLYIAVHLVVFAAALLVPGTEISLGHRRSLLSMTGLRATDGMFFFISPSWWFVWLILQLYVLFPFLFALQRRIPLLWFLTVTCGATFAVRGLAIAGFHYGDSLYLSMTGLFCGTRLAEFTVGMAAGEFAFRLARGQVTLPTRGQLLAGAVACYVAGFGCSLVLPGTIVSNLLVSIGLTGLLIFLWDGLLKRIPVVAPLLVWLGVESFGVFLLHHPPLMWTRNLFESNSLSHAVAAAATLILVMPASWLLRLAVESIQKKVARLRGEADTRQAAWHVASVIAGLSGLAFLLLLEHSLAGRPRLVALVIGSGMLLTAILQWATCARRGSVSEALSVAFLCAGFAALYLLPEGNGPVAALLGLLFGSLFAAVGRVVSASWLHRTFATGAVALLLICFSETALWKISPLETTAWGELPALQTHPTRGYALQPDLDMRLRYNNYDYPIRTNSLGLRGPEVKDHDSDNTLRILALGDAFTMPEGVSGEQSWPAVLQRSLADNWSDIDAEVLNAGVTGYSPVQSLPQLRELAPRLHPDLIVYQFFVNEFAEIVFNNDELQAAIGLTRCNERLDVRWLGRSQLYTRLQQTGWRLQELVTGRPHEWRIDKALVKFYEAGDNRLYTDERVEEIATHLREMKQIADQNGAEFLIVYVPSAAVVSAPEHIDYFPWGIDLHDSERFDTDRPRRILDNMTAALGIPLLDLTLSLQQHPNQPVYFPGSWHWNAEGHDVAGKAIAEFLRQPSAGADGRKITLVPAL